MLYNAAKVMKNLFDEAEKLTGFRACDDIELFGQLEFLANEGIIHQLDESKLRAVLPRLAFLTIQLSCREGEVGEQSYFHEAFCIEVTSQDVEDGKHLSEANLDTTDWEWWDFYFDAVESIIYEIQKRKVFS